MSSVKEAVRVQQPALERVMPQNSEAEMAVLGCILLEKDLINSAIEKMKSEYFYFPAHRIVYEAITALYEDTLPIDLISLTEKIRSMGQLDAVGGASFLSQLMQMVSSTAHFNHYLSIVVNKALLRSLITTSTSIISKCYKQTEEIEQLLDEVEREVFEVTQKKGGDSCVAIKDIIKGTIETVEKLYQHKQYITGIATGFIDFDVMTSGLQAADLIVLAARPSMGKTAFVLNVAEHMAVTDKNPVALFSLEMSKEQLVMRLLCSHARIDAHKVRTGFLAESDFPQLVNAAGKLAASPLFIDDTPGISVMELRAKARRLKAEHDIKCIIIDYLQLMQGPQSSKENRQQEISEISRSLKSLARELSVPVIVLSQLNRAVENRPDHRPMLSDLRESGAIEQDADVVMLLMRREYYEKENEDVKGLAEVIVAKQRNGPVGDVTLTFNDRYTRFDNYSSNNRGNQSNDGGYESDSEFQE